jgi:hypothetical protein
VGARQRPAPSLAIWLDNAKRTAPQAAVFIATSVSARGPAIVGTESVGRLILRKYRRRGRE